MFDTTKYEQKITQVLDHFHEELKRIRTGRAHAGMLDGVMVEAYGTTMPLNQVANITAAEASMLLVTPFDPSTIQSISASIRNNQTLGFNPSDDGRVVRIPVPALTEERRKLLVKQAGEKVEESRIGLRNVRQDAFKEAKGMKEAKQLGEDDLKRVEVEIDKLVKSAQDSLDEAFASKEKDILTI